MTAQKFEPLNASRRSPLEGAELQARICAVIDRALEANVADYEDGDRARIEALRRFALETLRESLGAIATVEAYCDLNGSSRVSEISPSGRGRGLCEVVDRHHRRPSGIDKIGDLAFVASIGLRSRLTGVESVGMHSDSWEVIAECSSAFREVLKSLTALELAICECEGLSPCSSFYVTELERALLTRRAYVSLRHDVLGAGAPTGDEIVSRLRLAGAAIAKLVSREIYVSARVHDRRLIRQVQDRIRAWLVSDPSGERVDRDSWLLAGVRLYQDIANACDLLLGINHRATLCAHDAEVLETELAELRARGPEPIALAEEFPRLESVAGRDAELDRLLRAGAPLAADEAAAVVERTLNQLRCGGSIGGGG